VIGPALRRRSFGRTLAFVATGALAVRVGYVLFASPATPFISDANNFHLLAHNLVAGDGYIRPFDLHFDGVVRATAEYPPGFPGLLALFDLIGVDGMRGQRFMLCVVGAGTVALVGFLGRAVHSERAGLIAAAIAAVHPLFFGSDGALVSESLATCGVVAALLLVFRIHRDESRVPARAWVALGIVLGVVTLTRSESALLGAALVGGLAVGVARRPGRAALYGPILAAVVAGALLVPWGWRNYRTFDRVVPLSNNVGGLINGANCPYSYAGERVGSWDFRCYDLVPVRRVNEADDAAVYRRAGIEYAREHAGEVPAVVGVRLLRTLGVWNPPQQARHAADEGRVFGFELAGIALDWLLVPLAVAGAVLLRRRRMPIWPLAAPVLVVLVVTVAGYGSIRFRASAEPVIAVLASVAIVDHFRARRDSERSDVRDRDLLVGVGGD
jgi:4-amino-4-deoxy-L-arabinose transferase-like glycosyltransferase